MLRRCLILIILMVISLPGIIEAGPKEEIAQGSRLFSKGKYEKARSEFQKLLDNYPKSKYARDARRYVETLTNISKK